MQKVYACLAVFVVAACLTFISAQLAPDSEPALQEALRLTTALANPALAPAERVTDQQELFEILSGTGSAFKTYGPITHPITNLSADQLPSTGHIPGGPSAKESAWKPGNNHFIPTNDWFQGMAGFPNKPGHVNSTGLYMLQWTGDKQGSVRFKVPVGFEMNGSSQPYILIPPHLYEPGFTIGAAEISGKPVVEWQETGNMARDISYNDDKFVIHAVQGALFQGASYRGITPVITVPAGGKMTKAALQDGMLKYAVTGKERTYFVYGNASLELTYDESTGKLTSGKPYTGSINIASLDNKNGDASILDAHANAVIVKAQGTLLPNYQYQFVYVSEDLSGQPTGNQPLVLLKEHHVANLQGQQPTGLFFTGLTGNMDAYAGATFVFTAPAPSTSENPLAALPKLANGQPALTLEQATALVNDTSELGLENALRKVSGLKSIPVAYNKRIYQQGLTLAFAQQILEMVYPNGNIPQKYRDAMDAVYQAMKAHMIDIFKNLQYDNDYGTIVSAKNDYGNHSHYNDHIAQYSYTLYALTFMKQYAEKYATSDAFFTAPITGLAYSGQAMGDLLASDIGETGPGGHNPLARNFDVYQSHSWLSGTQGYADGSNVESESEAVFGGLTIAGWLATTQPDSLQAQVAKTRWAMEAQGLQTYFFIDPTNSCYKKVSPEFVAKKTSGKIPPVVSNLFETKVTSDTFWGSEWDRQLACELMPAGANLMDSYLQNASPAYQKLVADYILKSWPQFDSNTIQSVLIAAVAKVYPDKVMGLIQDVQQRNKMDDGTNGFLLRVIGEYAKNQQALQ